MISCVKVVKYWDDFSSGGNGEVVLKENGKGIESEGDVKDMNEEPAAGAHLDLYRCCKVTGSLHSPCCSSQVPAEPPRPPVRSMLAPSAAMGTFFLNANYLPTTAATACSIML